MRFPKEIQEYQSSNFPEHPGMSMNVDVIKRSGQNILVCTDLFSKFSTACIIESEKASDLEKGIIQLTNPIRNSREVKVRVDKAKGFQSLKIKSNELKELGISIELAEDENKNPNCSVDKIIDELEN